MILISDPYNSFMNRVYFLVKTSTRNIQINRQYPNRDVTKDFLNIVFFCVFIYGATIARVYNF